MSCKIFHNKKALSEFILDIWSYIIFAVTIFLFLILFKLQSVAPTKNELRGIADIPTSSLTLNTYLRAPAIIDGNEISIAELIRLWHLNPDKYKSSLETASIDILNRLEYEYTHPQTKNKVVRGFHISINRQKEQANAINPIIKFKSKSFQDGLCISNQYGCINLGEQIIPISESSTLYIVLREGYKAK